jgi:dGTPase
LSIRNDIEEREKQFLSPHACLAAASRGRIHVEDECDLRTIFQRDRDRIIHSKSFRRLKHKTQVFISPVADHFRTRLTHTLEVAQIARTIARALRLNEDLTEAIALGHDLGHTPFGHSGEDVLDYILKNFYQSHFKHNEQSLRVADFLERDGRGLNLSHEVRDGILFHPQKEKTLPATLEGRVVRLADHLAYINHDIEDSIRAGILTKEALPRHAMQILGPNILDTLVNNTIKNSLNSAEIKMDKPIEDAMQELYQYLYDNVYTNPIAKSEENKTDHLLNSLFRYYIDHPENIDGYQKDWNEHHLVCAVTDLIAGMTDRFAINKYVEIFVPSEWRNR